MNLHVNSVVDDLEVVTPASYSIGFVFYLTWLFVLREALILVLVYLKFKIVLLK